MHRFAAILIFMLLLPASAGAGVLTADTVWENEVLVAEDILVPAGVSLTVLPGTVVRVVPADSTKIDPEYVSHRTEITVRGSLKVMGNADAPVLFAMPEGGGHAELPDTWAGIIIDGGAAEITWCTISGAETALTVTHGRLAAHNVAITENRYGLIIYGEDSSVSLDGSRVEQNDYGLFLFNGAKLVRKDSIISGNSKRDEFGGRAASPITTRDYSLEERVTTQVYRDEALTGVTIWQGRILVDGLVRLPPEGQLLIMPGTIVEFSRKDTNSDGIGENGLMIQGRFIAKGTGSAPIIFRSAEKNRAMGDWDSINILGSDQFQNLIEYCQVEDAYRGMHFHYANVAVTNSVLRNNYRGAQFQESLVTMSRNLFYGNKSGIQARDSEVVFSHNEVVGNQNGANFFRLDLRAEHNVFAGNEQDGMRVREGIAIIEDNRMTGNRFGLLVADANYTEVLRNFLGANLEAGLALRNSDHMVVSANAIQNNGMNGIVIRDSRGTISGNSIGANAERGIAIISFSGPISRNNIYGNGLYGIGLEGSGNVEARDNWWDGADLEQGIYDSSDEPGLGTVSYLPQSAESFPFAWSWPAVTIDTAWAGIVDIPEKVTVSGGATLEVRPGTMVRFAAGAGLEILGRIVSEGTAERRITYTSASGSGEPGDWDEISLQQAAESVFAYSDFSYAAWGLHSHFTPLQVKSCRFMKNEGGLRFRSGPLEITGSLFRENAIGIRSYRGVGRIHENEITANEIGIFVREKGAGLAINNNNIYANERYALRLGDFNREEVNARNNWWGGDDPAEVIFDGADEPYIGSVVYDPVLPSRVDTIVQ